MPRDLTPEQREQIADACDAAFDFGDTWIRFLRNGDESMLLPVVAQMLADERDRIAQHAEEMADAPLDTQLDRTTWRGALLAVASFARQENDR